MKKGNGSRSGKSASAGKGLTTARRWSRRNLAELAQGWDELEEWEREAWARRAAQKRLRLRRSASPESTGKRRSRTMRARELYMKNNRVLELCGYGRRRLPPPDPRFGPNPVAPELKLSRVKGRWVIKLVVGGAPQSDIMVFGSPPRRAGQGPGGNYAFLGLLPPPRDGECDITELYLTKLKEWRKLKSAQYQVPLGGARICIRTWPQDNGWEGKGRLMISQGLAPR